MDVIHICIYVYFIVCRSFVIYANIFVEDANVQIATHILLRSSDAKWNAVHKKCVYIHIKSRKISRPFWMNVWSAKYLKLLKAKEI